jgi:uncharacterized protein involved in type VI secretion and phage assembly
MTVWDQLFARSVSDGRFYGVVIGVVTESVDPDNLGRVKVSFPWLSTTDTSHWARVAAPLAGANRGFFLLPEVDDEVLVAFEHGMVERPYVIGSLWSSKDPPPDKRTGDANPRTLRTTSGHMIRLDDTSGEEKIEIIDKSGANSVVISTKDNTITITAKADVTIQATEGKLLLKGDEVEISAAGKASVTAGKDLDLKAGPNLNIEGGTVNIN